MCSSGNYSGVNLVTGQPIESRVCCQGGKIEKMYWILTILAIGVGGMYFTSFGRAKEDKPTDFTSKPKKKSKGKRKKTKTSVSNCLDTVPKNRNIGESLTELEPETLGDPLHASVPEPVASTTTKRKTLVIKSSNPSSSNDCKVSQPPINQELSASQKRNIKKREKGLSSTL